MILSILIVNWNTKDLLIECLDSIQKFSPSVPHEVIVVDNNSSDGSCKEVMRIFPSVTLIAQDRNLGYAEGNNRAFEIASGNYLLTLNPDTIFIDDSLDRAISYMENHKEIGAIGARQIGVDQKVQRSVRGFPTFIGLLGEVSGLANRFPESKWGSYRMPNFDYETEQDAPQPMGTFLLFRRTALDQVGDSRKPFDPQFPLFYNEVDLLKRLSDQDWKCRYVPSVSIVHYGGESTKQVRKFAIWESHRSLLKYWKKHSKSFPESLGITLISPLIFLIALIRARGYSRGFRT